MTSRLSRLPRFAARLLCLQHEDLESCASDPSLLLVRSSAHHAFYRLLGFYIPSGLWHGFAISPVSKHHTSLLYPPAIFNLPQTVTRLSIMPPGHRKSASRDVSATIDREPSKSHSRKPSISKVQSRGVLTRATRRTRVSSEPDVSDAESSSSSKVVEAVVEKTERPNHETMIDDSDFYPNESKGWKGFANCVSIGVIVNLVCLWAIPASARHEIAAVSRRPTRSDDPELNAIVPALKLLSMAAMWFLGFDGR